MTDLNQLSQILIEKSPDAIFLLDPESVVRLWNPAAEKMFDLLAKEAIGVRLEKSLTLPDLFWRNPSDSEVRNDASATDWQPLSIVLSDARQLSVDAARISVLLDHQSWTFWLLRHSEIRPAREAELVRAAKTDELSQLLNRRGFQKCLEEHSSQPLVLAILDVDNFKQINDGHGHTVGDGAIRFVAKTLTDFFSDAICVARLGGDEFGVVLATTSQQEVANQFETLRAHFQSAQFSKKGLALTVSVGVAISQSEGISIRQLLASADQAMYGAKRAGRNRVEVVTIPPRSGSE